MPNNNSKYPDDRDLTMIEHWEIDDQKAAQEAATKTDS